jgi:hypothetical protein
MTHFYPAEKNIPLTSQEIEYDLKVADFVKNCPCSWCGKKSTARIRTSESKKTIDADSITVIASCDNHHLDLAEIANIMFGNAPEKFFPIKTWTISREQWENTK